jgi:hypothetical protein
VLDRIVALVEEGGRQAKAGSEPSRLAAEGVAGGVLSVIHARMHGSQPVQLTGLAGPLMAMIVLPYLGPAAARRELARPVPSSPAPVKRVLADPLREVNMRLTYRTIRVLMAVAAHPGSSNREIGLVSGISDQGQISKLLTRLVKLELIENSLTGRARGAPNAWVLTPKGAEIERVTGFPRQECSTDKADRAGVR